MVLCCAVILGLLSVDQFWLLPKSSKAAKEAAMAAESSDDDSDCHAKNDGGGIGRMAAVCYAHCSDRQKNKKLQQAKNASEDPKSASQSSSSSSTTTTTRTAATTTSATASTTAAAMPSFYQRRLPETCVAFASREGKEIFRSALQRGGLKAFYNLIEQHHTQTEPAFCGISTLVLVLNALAVDPHQKWKGPWRWYEEKMLNCCVDLEEIKQSGITLSDFQCLAFCQGLTVDLRYCDETSTQQDFRSAVERACLEDNEEEGGREEDRRQPKLECLVVSYSRKVLQQTGDGHFSPLAAYDKESDSVLILDTARFKYGAHWTKLPLLYEAMKPVDKSTGKSRGYCLLSFDHHDDDEMALSVTTASTITQATIPSEPAAVVSPAAGTTMASTQPASILYRSMMNQNRKRRLYKEYISSLRDQHDEFRGGKDIPYDLIRPYWYKGGNDNNNDNNRTPSSVWDIIIPTKVRNEEERELLRKMRLLLADLHRATVAAGNDDPSNNDDDNSGETYHPSMASDPSVSISAEQTVVIIYLATLSRDRRYEIVTNLECDASDDVRDQVLKESEMIASAIEVSDKLTSL